MAYRHTVISNLKYVDEVFHNIAHNIPHPNEQGYDGQYDETLPKCECVDDRFSTGFGSTYEVVVDDFPKREEEIEITIFGDTWLHVETVAYEEHYMDRWETNEDTVKISRIPFKESLPEVLQRVYPNATINLVGDFSSSASTEINLDDVWDYLQGLSDYPDYFIFNGVDKTLVSEGKIYTIQKLKDIDSFLKEKKIKACCVFTATLEVDTIDIKDYAEVFSTTTKMLKFSTYEWASHHLSLIESNYGVSGNETGIDEFFGDISLQLSFSRLNYYISDDFNIYKELVYTVIKRFILEQLFILHRECFYISLLYKSVDGGMNGSTYNYYFGTDYKPYNLMCSFVAKEHVVTIQMSPRITGHHQTKYGEDSNWNLFKQDGQFVAFCLHTSFSEYQWAWQQGQSNCYEQWNQLRSYKVKHDRPDDILKDRDRETTTPANILTERVYHNTNTDSYAYEYSESLPKGGIGVSPPIFPGTGCPMLTISYDNRIKYRNNCGLGCPIEIWVTRDEYTFSVTIRIHTEDSYTEQSSKNDNNIIAHPDLYQSIEFGKMSVKETENYIYPLYCGGGSTGLSSDIYSFYPVRSIFKTYLVGNVYDLDMNNICLSNSNILHPTIFYGSMFTNFKILTPEGMWRDVVAHRQDASVVPYPSLEQTPDFAIHLDPPTQNVGLNQAAAYPYLMNNWNSVGSQHIKNRNWFCREPVDNKEVNFTSRLDSIRVAIKGTDYEYHPQYLNYGIIPHCWRSWDKEIPSGEFISNGKKYLAVPCGWDGRLWDYGYHLGIYNDTWDFDEVVNEFEKYYYAQNARIEDKLIIELGDADV